MTVGGKGDAAENCLGHAGWMHYGAPIGGEASGAALRNSETCLGLKACQEHEKRRHFEMLEKSRGFTETTNFESTPKTSSTDESSS